MARPIGTLGNIPTITVGGRVFTDLTSLKFLAAYITTGSTDIYSSLRLTGTSTGYAAVNTLTIYAVQANFNAANGAFKLGSGTSSVSSTTAPTGATDEYGVYSYGVGAAYADKAHPTNFAVTVGRIPYVQASISGSHVFQAWGYDV